MDYKEKYEHALEIAREIIKDYENRGLKDNLFYANEDFEAIFPELKESEDERIRKALLNEFIHLQSKGYKFAGLEGEDIIAWLEKQKKPEDMVHITELKVWPANSATAANRQLYNRAILKILSDYVEKYPDTRFGQMLYNLGISSAAENNFYVESSKTYQDINTILKEQKNEKNRII